MVDEGIGGRSMNRIATIGSRRLVLGLAMLAEFAGPAAIEAILPDRIEPRPVTDYQQELIRAAEERRQVRNAKRAKVRVV